MKYLLIGIACIIICLLIEYLYNKYLDKLPKGQRDTLIKRQSKMRCPICGGTEFEVFGFTSKSHKKLKWQCKRCGRVK